jgi:hypothetical protein
MRALLLIYVFWLPLALFAQDNTRSVKKFPLLEVGVATGIGPSAFNPFGDYDIHALAPGSSILADTNKWPGSPTSLGDFDANLSVWGGFGIKNKANPLIRLGLTYAAGQPLSFYDSREIAKTFDTLRSANSPMVVYADSVYETRGSVQVFTQHLKFDAAVLWHSKNRGRFGWFAGIGGQIGMSVLARTQVWYAQVEHQHFRTIEDPNRWLRSFNSNPSSTATEVFRNGTQFVVGLYVPLGLSMRLGSIGSTLEKTQVFLQFSPRLGTLYAPELGWLTRSQMFTQVGLRLGMQ